MSKFRILSVDGGGIRGMVAATLLARIEDENPGFVSSVDLFAGTSTGSIISCALACGKQPKKIVELYASCGSRVFKKDRKHLFGLTGSKYVNTGLRDLLISQFGELRLGNVAKKILVPTFDLCSGDEPKRWKPKFFHNFGNDSDCSALLVDVVQGSCSAPTYFPATNGYIDGGMVANNPSMAALCQALDSRGGGVKLDEIVLLSIGTGEIYSYIGDPDYSFGLLDVSKVINITLGGTESVPDYQCKTLLGGRYLRIDPADPKGVALDDYKQVAYLRRLGVDYDLNECMKWIGREW